MIPSNPLIYGIPETAEFGTASQFLYPDNIVSPLGTLEDFEMGGIALQDPTEGLLYQPWHAWWDESDSSAYLKPLDSPEEAKIFMFTQADVEDFTFTFDQNMRWLAATRTSTDDVTLYWYDPQLESYSTLLWSGWQSIKLTHDSKSPRLLNLGQTDAILSYITTGGQLGWRIQRDRYGVPYMYGGETFSESTYITHFGLSKQNRLQWRLGYRRILPDGHST